MAKDPAFLFYTGDFTTGTQFFTDAQVGIYIRLLMAQHQHGRLTEKQVLLISKTLDIEVMQKFTIDESGLFYNQRLEAEIEKRKTFSDSRRGNRLGKTKQVNNTSSSSEQTSDLHMEDENKNENRFNKKGIAEFLLFESAKENDPEFYKFVSVYKETLLKGFPNDFMQIQTMPLSDFSPIAREMIQKHTLLDVQKVLKTCSESDFWKPQLYNLGAISKNFMAIKNLQIIKPGKSEEKPSYKAPAKIDFTTLE